MKVTKVDLHLDDEIFTLEITNNDHLVGHLVVFRHPKDIEGGQVHIDIVEHWRKKWVSRSLKNILIEKLISESKKNNLNMLYSVALTPVSHRLLEFANFFEYNIKQPKTYYYLEI